MRRLSRSQWVYLILLGIDCVRLTIRLVLRLFLTAPWARDFEISPWAFLGPVVLLALFITDRLKLLYANIAILALCAVYFLVKIPLFFINDGLTLVSALSAVGNAGVALLIVIVLMSYPWQLLKRARRIRRGG